MLQAGYCVRKNWGYVVIVYRQMYDAMLGYYWEDIDVYEAGNSKLDSGIFGSTDPVDRNTLMKYARQTARELLTEHGYQNGRVFYEAGLLSD